MLTDLEEKCQNIRDALADYPVFSDEAYSEMEWEAAQEAWHGYGAREIMTGDTDDLVEDWEEKLFEHVDWEYTGYGFVFTLSDDFDLTELEQ